MSAEPAIAAAARLAACDAALRRVVHPLPGARPWDNRRPLNMRAAHDRWCLLDVLLARFPQIAAAEWESRCAAGRFVNQRGNICGSDYRVRAGEQVYQIFPLEIEPPVATDIRVVYEDEAVMLVNKPAPLPMHPSGRFHRNTLQHFLKLAFAPQLLRPVHRLDSNTSGLVLFARTRHCCHLLQRQFIAGRVDKRYLVRVTGHPPDDRFFSTAAIAAAPAVLGTRRIDEQSGQAARTDFQVIKRHADGTALLEAVLGSGRTNQIRLHLWHLGHAVVGDPAYLTGGRMGDTQTLALASPALQLHAWQLAFHHPLSGEPLSFTTARPAWA